MFYSGTVTHTVFVDISQLRLGMFVHLDTGWLNHPFRSNRFRLSSPSQIHVLKDMGLKKVRCVVPAGMAATSTGAELPLQAVTEALQSMQAQAAAEADRMQARQCLREQQVLDRCDQSFAQATVQFRGVVHSAAKDLAAARALSESVVFACVAQLLEYEEPAIYLLSQSVGERAVHHPVNVMVLCLLLGKVQGLGAVALQHLGMAALLHDLGKLGQPENLAQPLDHWTDSECQAYKKHVEQSVALAQRMGLADSVLEAIAQHHEMADGSGFPLHLHSQHMQVAAKVLALVNHYDGLCNPATTTDALTPHEALSHLFVQCKKQFDPLLLQAFIRMMGVYPPGSVVQLADGRHALVLSVNSAKPLKPRVLVHDPDVPRQHARTLNLEDAPQLGIRCSLKPLQLPRAAFEYLAPRHRVSYFFERSLDVNSPCGTRP